MTDDHSGLIAYRFPPYKRIVVRDADKRVVYTSVAWMNASLSDLPYNAVYDISPIPELYTGYEMTIEDPTNQNRSDSMTLKKTLYENDLKAVNDALSGAGRDVDYAMKLINEGKITGPGIEDLKRQLDGIINCHFIIDCEINLHYDTPEQETSE